MDNKVQLTAIFTVLVLIFVGVAVLVSGSHSSDSEDDITGYWYQVGYEGYRPENTYHLRPNISTQATTVFR